MPPPVIGIATALEQARWGVWNQPAMLIAQSYVLAVQRAGGLVLMLPPDPAVTADPDLVLDLLDGLMLAGGADLDPATYGATRDPLTQESVRERDECELALAARAMERDIPLLGICRGMQVINVARGGTLIQDLPTRFGTDEHCRVPGSFDGAGHAVSLEAGSLAARAAGESEHVALSHHHQGLDRVGDDLVVSGRASGDGLPEAIEVPDRRFVLGVQWHPEADIASHVVTTLVEEAREYALARAL